MDRLDCKQSRGREKKNPGTIRKRGKGRQERTLSNLKGLYQKEKGKPSRKCAMERGAIHRYGAKKRTSNHTRHIKGGKEGKVRPGRSSLRGDISWEARQRTGCARKTKVDLGLNVL